MRKSDMAAKNMPACALLKLRVTSTVRATVSSADAPAPTRPATPPLATLARPGGGARVARPTGADVTAPVLTAPVLTAPVLTAPAPRRLRLASSVRGRATAPAFRQVAGNSR